MANLPGVYSFFQFRYNVSTTGYFYHKQCCWHSTFIKFLVNRARNYLKVKFVLREGERAVLTLYLQLLLL